MIIFIFQFGLFHTIYVYIYVIHTKKETVRDYVCIPTQPAEAAHNFCIIISVPKHFFGFVPCHITYSIKKIPDS